MSKKSSDEKNQIIEEDKEFLNLRSFSKILEPRELSWKSNQLFQFEHPEIEKSYEENKMFDFKITRRSLDFFSQGRKPSQCFHRAINSGRGQGFALNTALGTDGKSLIGVIDLIPAWNHQRGDSENFSVPFSTSDGSDFVYNGIKFAVFSSYGTPHYESKRLTVEAAKGTAAERFYQLDMYYISGGIWVGERDHIGRIAGRSASHNIGNFVINPLFLMCHYSPNFPIDSFARIIVPEIYEPLREFLSKILPTKDNQERNITVVAEEHEDRHLLNSMKSWEK